MEGQEGGSSEPPEPPLHLPLLLHMHEVTLKTCKLGLLFNVLPIVCGGSVSVFVWYALLCVLFIFAIILKRKRELVALLLLSYGCLITVNVLWLFLTIV